MSFTPEKAAEKLRKLDETQQSIQSTSQWCLFHYRHHREIVQLWLKSLEALREGDPRKALVYFYLCNDLVQFSKKNEHKFRGFLEDFVKVLPRALKVMHECAHKECAGDSRREVQLLGKYTRVLKVWEERNIFDKRFIAKLRKQLDPGSVAQDVKRAQISAAREQRNRALESIVSRNDSHAGANGGANNVPAEVKDLVAKYKLLESLQEKNLADFTRISTIHNELFKSKKNLPEPRKLIERLQAMQRMCSAIKSQMDKATDVRSAIESELKKLIGLQNDWVQLDKGKLDQIETIAQEVAKQKLEMEKLAEATGVAPAVPPELQPAPEAIAVIPAAGAAGGSGVRTGDADDVDDDDEEISPMYETGGDGDDDDDDDDMPVYAEEAEDTEDKEIDYDEEPPTEAQITVDSVSGMQPPQEEAAEFLAKFKPEEKQPKESSAEPKNDSESNEALLSLLQKLS